MGGYSEKIGFGGARGRTIDMTDEEIYRKLRREYPTASDASLVSMMGELKYSQNPKYTVGIDPAGGSEYTLVMVSKPNEYEFGFTGFRTASNSKEYEIDLSEVQRIAGTQQANVNSQNALANQLSAITYEQLQNQYNAWLTWNGNPSYGITSSQQYFPPPPMSPEPDKPAKKKAQSEIVVTGKRSIILDGDI